MRYSFIYLALLTFLLEGCVNYNLQSFEGGSADLTSSISSNARAEKIIAPYRLSLEATMSEVLNQSEVVMERNQPEGLLGNFVADLCMDQLSMHTDLEADFCLLNNGGLRTPLPKGDITRGKIYELMPFENQLVVIHLKGQAMRNLVTYLIKCGGMPVSNFRMKTKDDDPIHIYVGNEQIDFDRTYRVLTSDYLARGGDSMSFFKQNEKWENSQLKIRDAIINHVMAEQAAGRRLTAALDKRLEYE